MQAYALWTVRNYVMMAVYAGCSEDQVFGMVVDGIDRAMAARSSGRAAAPPEPGADAAAVIVGMVTSRRPQPL